MLGYLLCDDLMFSSRITGTARDLGLSIKTVRSSGDLERLHSAEPATCVVVDLSNPGLQIADLLARLRPSAESRTFVVAYGSHVDTATLQAARAAGCNVVLPRSKFVEELPRSLPTWFNSPT